MYKLILTTNKKIKTFESEIIPQLLTQIDNEAVIRQEWYIRQKELDYIVRKITNKQTNEIRIDKRRRYCQDVILLHNKLVCLNCYTKMTGKQSISNVLTGYCSICQKPNINQDIIH